MEQYKDTHYLVQDLSNKLKHLEGFSQPNKIVSIPNKNGDSQFYWLHEIKTQAAIPIDDYSNKPFTQQSKKVNKKLSKLYKKALDRITGQDTTFMDCCMAIAELLAYGASKGIKDEDGKKLYKASKQLCVLLGVDHNVFYTNHFRR